MQGLDSPQQHVGVEDSPDVFVARRQVSDSNRTAVAIVEGRLEYCRISDVFLLAVREVKHLDFEKTGQVFLRIVAQ